MNKITKQDKSYVVSEKLKSIAKEIISIWSNAADDMYKGCLLYVKRLDEMPELKPYLVSQGVDPAHLRRFEEVGRGKLHPQLTFKSGSQYNRLARCPLSEQEKYISSPVPVLLPNGDILKVSVPDLTPDQSAQVFSHDHIRDIPAQKAYLKSEESCKTRKIQKASSPYKIFKDHLSINEPCNLTKSELIRILGDMG